TKSPRRTAAAGRTWWPRKRPRSSRSNRSQCAPSRSSSSRVLVLKSPRPCGGSAAFTSFRSRFDQLVVYALRGMSWSGARPTPPTPPPEVGEGMVAQEVDDEPRHLARADLKQVCTGVGPIRAGEVTARPVRAVRAHEVEVGGHRLLL